MTIARWIIVLVFLLPTAVIAAAGKGGPLVVPAAKAGAAGVEEIGRGDPRRQAILDALRIPVSGELGAPIEFVVETLRVDGDFAFAQVSAQRPGGEAIDISRTPYAEAEAEGMFDGPTVVALLRQSGGAWSVVTYAIGPTDVVWEPWSAEYGAPAALFAW
jgi:hypothetical protein